MAENSKIEWTTHTFNPWWGCTKVSQGCKNCYAETLSARYKKDIWGPGKQREGRAAAYWKDPLKWNTDAAGAAERPRVFCASMADVFEDNEQLIPWRMDLFDLIRQTPNLDWLLLTKRPENIFRMIAEPIKHLGGERISLKRWLYAWACVDQGAPKNVWLGTSVEDQDAAAERIPELLKVPAVVRFLSCEPLLGPVELFRYDEDECALRGVGVIRSGGMTPSTPDTPPEGYDDSYPGIDWVICGGESGPGARPMHPDWARSLRDQCARAGVPYLFKQWGNWVPDIHHWPVKGLDTAGRGVAERDERERLIRPEDRPRAKDGAWGVLDYDGNFDLETTPWNGIQGDYSETREYVMFNIGKHAAGRVLDGRTHDEYPEVSGHASL